MNGSGTSGIIPTVDLATNNSFPYGFMGGYGNNGFFGGDGIWAIVLLALLFNNGGWGFGGNNGWNNVATTDYISSEFTQRDINSGFQNTNNAITNGFQNLGNAVAGGFSDTATSICGLKGEVLENRYANQLSACNTQRDILTQTNELNTNLLTTALQAQAKMDDCCCTLRAQGIENTQKILDVLNQNTIDDLRSQVNDLKNTITANGIGTSIVNQVRPYPVPAYAVSSPYVGLNGFYGSNWYGNTIV